MKTTQKENIRVSSDLCLYTLRDGRVAAWNKFFPKIMLLSPDFKILFAHMQNNSMSVSDFKGKKRLLNTLLKNKVLVDKPGESEKERYLQEGEAFLYGLESEFRLFQTKGKHYSHLNIHNQACNLACSYCVVDKVRKSDCLSVRASAAEKQNALFKVVAQFIERNANAEDQREIAFNGGEFLLEFELLRNTIEYIKSNYPNIKLKISLNTNATLIDDRIAQYLAENSVDVAISVDGYPENSDTTRRYHNGKGAFEDIIKGVGLLNKYHPVPRERFQGTLVPNESFSIDKIQEMAKYGFNSARLGVDLLSISPEEARKMAQLHVEMVNKTQDQKVKVTDLFYNHYRNVFTGKVKSFHFDFFCESFSVKGLNAFNYNIDLDMGNVMCGFLPNRVAMADVDHAIFHPLFFERGIHYLKKRFDGFRENCANCEVAAICKGGCIMIGLDANNRINKSACTFMVEAWHEFLELFPLTPSL